MKTWGLKTVLVNALLFLLSAYIVPGFTVASVGTALLGAVMLAILNLIVGSLLRLFTLPANVLTLGCLSGVISTVINTVVLILVSETVQGIHFETFWVALIVGVILGIGQSLIGGK